MKHDYTICFETENELWQRVLDIFEKNESFPKKKVKGRELHHKFPRSFSKKLGELVDNEPDNLISLTPDDHFRVHYYYYVLARKGFKQPMSLAFDLMVRPMGKQISPATMEECACDYAELRRERLQAWLEKVREWRNNNPEKEQERIKKDTEKQQSDEVRKKKSESMKGKNKGEKNGMYGKSTAIKGHSCTDWMTDEEIVRWKEAISRSLKGRQMSDEFCQKMSDIRKGNGNPMFRRFSWKISGNKFNNILLPEDIPDDELNEYRTMLRFLNENNDWKERIKKLTELCELMDEINK